MKVRLQAGVDIDLLNKQELIEALVDFRKSWVAELARGVQFPRFSLSGTVDGSGVLEFGGATGSDRSGPDNGMVWSIRRLAVTGVTGTQTVSVFVNSSSPHDLLVPGITLATPILLPENTCILRTGDHLVVAGSSLTNGAKVTLSGHAKEVPEFALWML